MHDPVIDLLTDQPELLAALDAYAVDATDRPPRPELVRRILADWLVANGYLQSDPLAKVDGYLPDQPSDEGSQ